MNNPAFQQVAPVLCKHANKWSAAFEAYGIYDGRRVLIASCTGGAVWDSEDAAQEGGHRALSTLEKTGKFPNMCAVW